VKRKTQSARKRRDFWLRAGIWAFIIIFAFSIVGGALIAFGTLR
jgi:small neutral amino acid transporter SnatA (MarC family)